MLPRLLLLLCLLLPLYAGGVPQGTDLSQLNKGDTPSQNYRERVFCAYKPLGMLHQRFKVGNYSSYENPTGIYYKAGQQIRLTLHNTPSGQINFIIHNFCEDGGHDVYPLKRGDNDIVVKHRGLGYVDYRSPRGNKAPKVRMTLHGGIINGIFSQHDDTATWKRLLKRVPAGVLDMMGERCQVIFHKEGLVKGAKDQGVEMLKLYDRIVELQQNLMGWDKEGIHPGNHMTCRVIWRGFMHADGEGAAFHKATIAGLSDPEGLRKGAWGVAHELGHVNQVRPVFCWAGLTEVSNNVFSSWCNYDLHKEDMRLEHEVSPTPEGQQLRGGRFDCYINSAIVKKQLWQFQSGPDSGVDKVPGKFTGDHFVSVCPLWQLLLYCQVARGNEDFYPDIFHKLRAQDAAGMSHGQMRVDFCRYISESAKLNMSEFLMRTGMLGLMNRHVHDYSSHMVTVSLDMVKDTLKKAAKLPEPDSSVIYYINANNVEIYRDRLPLKSSPGFRPEIPTQGGNIVFPGKEWKNAVAFEVYKGKELIRICLRGLGQKDNASTTVICPPGATSIKAVQWDGKRVQVTGRKSSKSHGQDEDDEEEEA